MANDLARTNVKQYLASPVVRKRTEELLGKRSGQFITSVTAMVNADNKLAECEPTSLFMAALTAAALDLPVNKNLAFAHIVPYKNTKAGVTEAQFQMGWKGYVQLAQRTGQYKTIAATEVYEGQLTDEDPLAGNTYDWKAKTSDTVIGYVAKFKLTTGFEKELYMSMADIKKHAGKYSQAYKSGYGPWKDNFDAMALKTVIKLLISKWGPMSVEMQRAVEVDSSVIKEDGQTEYIDGELADVGADDDQKAAIIAANTQELPENDAFETETSNNVEETEQVEPKKSVKEKANDWAERRIAKNHEGEQSTLIDDPKASYGDDPQRKSGK